MIAEPLVNFISVSSSQSDTCISPVSSATYIDLTLPSLPSVLVNVFISLMLRILTLSFVFVSFSSSWLIVLSLYLSCSMFSYDGRFTISSSVGVVIREDLPTLSSIWPCPILVRAFSIFIASPSFSVISTFSSQSDVLTIPVSSANSILFICPLLPSPLSNSRVSLVVIILPTTSTSLPSSSFKSRTFSIFTIPIVSTSSSFSLSFVSSSGLIVIDAFQPVFSLYPSPA